MQFMIMEWTILNKLQDRNSLMDGKLLWDSSLQEDPMNFHVPSASCVFTAIPEIKSKLTSAFIDHFIELAKHREASGSTPQLLIVPYLSKPHLDHLDQGQYILAADLCGNGLLKKPPFYMRLSGNPNLFPSPTRVARPYSNTSAQAAMVLLEKKIWQGQRQILERMELRGGKMTKGQLSKVISSYQQDGVIRREGKSHMIVHNPGRLLDRLQQEWRQPEGEGPYHYRLPPNLHWKELIRKANDKKVKWCYSPEYSLRRYASFGEEGPIALWTNDPSFFWEHGKLEKVNSPAFSQLNLTFISSPLAFFQTEKSSDGSIWSGPVMTWIQASRGDARQQETARQLYTDLVNFRYPQLINAARS